MNVREMFDRDPEMRAEITRLRERAGGVSGVAGPEIGAIPGMPPLAGDEAIIRHARPVVLVKDGKIQDPPSDVWKQRIAAARTVLETAVHSVGRIELVGHPDYAWVGTGWVVGDGIIVTNRHVAHEFAMRGGNGFVFRKNPERVTIDSRIDFAEEYGVIREDLTAISEVLYIADEEEHDLAFLRITGVGRAALTLATEIVAGRRVATCGYPAEDGMRNDPITMRDVFGDIYDKKRFAPGYVTAVKDDYLTHDCSTLGGNSGSPVIDFETGAALGLHFSGRYRVANYAVPAPVVRQYLDRIGNGRPIEIGRSPDPRALEMVGRSCTLVGDYQNLEVQPVKVTGKIITYVSPDCTWPVTQRIVGGAQTSITVGIYDFSAKHVKRLLTEKIGGDEVETAIMLDIDSDKEAELLEELADEGADTYSAPSCANSSSDARHFPSSHWKVIVVDEEWCMVQSGNWSDNSCPESGNGEAASFRQGNRDMGLAVQSEELSKFFLDVFANDVKLSEEGTNESRATTPIAMTAFVEAPKQRPKKLFQYKEFDVVDLEVRPVLTPDNYVPVVEKLLRSAKKRIWIEQQYIRSSQDKIQKLLRAIRKARQATPDLDVRIILAALFSVRDFEKEQENLDRLANVYGLEMGDEIKILNPRRYTHCHNKLILVDDATVLVGSQNWSNTAVGTNREASLLLTHDGIAEYFSGVFEIDWETGVPELVTKSWTGDGESVARTRGRDLVEVDAADYAEV